MEASRPATRANECRTQTWPSLRRCGWGREALVPRASGSESGGLAVVVLSAPGVVGAFPLAVGLLRDVDVDQCEAGTNRRRGVTGSRPRTPIAGQRQTGPTSAGGEYQARRL